METLLFTLSILLGLLGYATYNLMRKVEKYEDILNKRTEVLIYISNTIEEAKRTLDNLNLKKAFESDDEAGVFFTQMVEIQDTLNRFIISENQK